MDHESFEACLKKWSRQIIDELEDYQVNIDGKVLRATGKRGKRRLLYAW
ncbi:MAG: hypothetical protein AAF740_02740 [Bacteroidota bacterium]